MTTVDDCLNRAAIGEIVKVCLEPAGRDRFDRVKWSPSAKLTPYQFAFPIIAITYGTPVIGVPNKDTVSYGFSVNTGKYGKDYSSTYVLYPEDIKTTKIWKAIKKAP